MIIIGVDFHPEFQQIALVDTDTGEFQERRLHIARKRKSFIVLWRAQEKQCVWGWKPVGTHAGLNDC